MPNITKKVFSVGIFLQDGDEMESNIRVMNVKYKGTRMGFLVSEKYGLYYLHASRIQIN